MRTRGDWQFKPLKNAGPTVVAVDDTRLMQDQHGKAWPTIELVCECRSMDDAALVSAAPDLLNAAEQIIDSMGPDDQPPSNSSIALLRAAYAKATVVDREWVEFSALVGAWKGETMHLSSLSQVFDTEHYQKILGMGERAVPLIIRQLYLEGRTPYHWWGALRQLTKANPVPRWREGNVGAMSEYWIKWARKHYANRLGAWTAVPAGWVVSLQNGI